MIEGTPRIKVILSYFPSATIVAVIPCKKLRYVSTPVFLPFIWIPRVCRNWYFYYLVEANPSVWEKNVFLDFLAGLRLVVFFMRWSKYIENAKFCAESIGSGAFY
jgi:hypothetical protein